MTTARYSKAPILARYRPGGSWWFLILLFAGMGGALPAVTLCTPHTFADLVQAWSFGGVLIFFGVGLALIVGKAIDVDAAGLTYWNWRGKRRIAWTDISDYCLHLPRKRSQWATIRTASGDILLSSNDRGYDDFLKCVPEHTGHLPVKEWEVLGCRPNDEATVVFRYTWRFEAGLAAVSTAMTAWLVVGALIVVVRNWAVYSQYAGLAWAIGFAIVALLVPFVSGVMAWVHMMGTRDCWERRNDRVSITSQGIRYENAREVIDAPWSSGVTWHSVKPKRDGLVTSKLTVITGAGTFEVSSQIGMSGNLETYRLLRCLLERYAGRDTQPLPEEGVNAHATGRWAHQIAGGTKVHHYRTPINRALLLMVCGYALAIMAGLLVASLAGTLAVSASKTAWTLSVTAIVTGYAQWRYRASAVITDDTGIRAYTMLGERRLAWEDVTEYRKGDSLATVRDKYGAIRFWLTISEAKQLQKTIQERAVNSKTREWKPSP